MKMKKVCVVLLVLMAVLAGVSQAVTLTSTGNVALDSATNWSPSQVPDSTNDTLSIGHNLAIDSIWEIGSGQAITRTGGSWRFAEGGHLTVASGGTLTADGIYETGATATRSLTIEAGATATTRRYISGNGTVTGGDSGWTTKWIADASGVTTFNITADYRIRGGSIEVDLSSYDILNGTTLILADYATLYDGPYYAVTLAGGWTGTVDYTYDQGSGDLAIALINIAAPTGSDTTPPVITLLGDNPMEVILGTTFTDPNATALDDRDGDISDDIIVSGDVVDPCTLGTYYMDYDVSDAASNAATQVTRTVNVVLDTTPPVITLLGADPMDVLLGTTFTDPGATAEDNLDGDISDDIVVSGDVVDPCSLGTYYLDYDVSDAASNVATQVTRTVNVVSSITIVWDDGAGNDLWDSGDNWVGDVAPVNGNSVELGSVGDIRLDSAFTIENGQSLTASGTGYDPELILESSAVLTLATGGTMDIVFMRTRYTDGGQFIIEPGATLDTDYADAANKTGTFTFIADATGVTTWNNSEEFSGNDQIDLVVDLSNYDIANGDTLILVDYGTFDLGFASVTVTGGFTADIDYAYDLGGGDLAIALTDIDDGSGGDITPPVITLVGANPIYLLKDDSFTDPGATALDNIDGDITGSIVVTGDVVDTSTVGVYYLDYDVIDAASNAAVTVTRTVIVALASTADVSWDGDAGDGLWASATNWSTDALPAIDDTIEINSATVGMGSDVIPAGATVNLIGPAVLNGLGVTRLTNANTINVGPQAELGGGVFFDIRNSISFDSGAKATMSVWELKETPTFTFNLDAAGFTTIAATRLKGETEPQSNITWQVDMANYTGGEGTIVLVDWATNDSGSSKDITAANFQNCTLNILNPGPYTGSLSFDDATTAISLTIGMRPIIATDPDPADDAINVPTLPRLTWIPSYYAVSHTLFFGETGGVLTEVLPAPTDPNYFVTVALDKDTEYSWRVDTFDGVGTNTGDVWSFTTTDGRVTDPDPADGATGVSNPPLLAWTAGEGAVNYNVYIGDANDALTEVSYAQTDPNYLVTDVLIKGAEYFWAVDTFNGTGTITGDVWSFTTATLARTSWTNGDIADELWSSEDNWDNGTPGYGTDIDLYAAPNVLIDETVDALGGLVRLDIDRLLMTGGSLTTTNHFLMGQELGTFPVFEMSGGIANLENLWVGHRGKATVIMDGGTINIAGNLIIPQANNDSIGVADGLVLLNAGVMTASTIDMVDPNGILDLSGGTLILDGDDTATVNGYILADKIIAYGGTGSVSVNYDYTNPGKTTIVGCPNIISADFTGDCVVNADDLGLLVQDWLFSSSVDWSFDMSTDPNGPEDYDLAIRDEAKVDYNMVDLSGAMHVTGDLLLDDQSAALGLWDTDLHVVCKAASDESAVLDIWAEIGVSGTTDEAIVGFSVYLDSGTNKQTVKLWTGNVPWVSPETQVTATGFAADTMIDVTVNYDYETNTFNWTATDGTVSDGGTSVPYTAFQAGDGGDLTIRGVAGTDAYIDQLDYSIAGSDVYSVYDLQPDGSVDLLDFAVIASEWLK